MKLPGVLLLASLVTACAAAEEAPAPAPGEQNVVAAPVTPPSTPAPGDGIAPRVDPAPSPGPEAPATRKVVPVACEALATLPQGGSFQLEEGALDHLAVDVFATLTASRLEIALTSTIQECGIRESSLRPRDMNETRIVLDLAVNNRTAPPKLGAGTYTAGETVRLAVVTESGERCTDPNAPFGVGTALASAAATGTVVVVRSDATAVEGTFDVVAGKRRLKGKFVAPVCKADLRTKLGQPNVTCCAR